MTCDMSAHMSSGSGPVDMTIFTVRLAARRGGTESARIHAAPCLDRDARNQRRRLRHHAERLAGFYEFIARPGRCIQFFECSERDGENDGVEFMPLSEGYLVNMMGAPIGFQNRGTWVASC